MPARARRTTPARTVKLSVRPVTPARWPDLERLFGPRGACAGCWCMWWRLPRARWVAGKGEGNRRALRRMVEGGVVPGLIAYRGGEPVGWVAVEPRDAYPGLDRSRTLARLDDRPVWSVPCFFVARAHRGTGVTRALLDAAVRHARGRGARIVEGYPVEYRGGVADDWVFTGAPSTFRKAGFREVARRSPTRPVFRRILRGP
ncbi:MAG TPA: GNAT family N-acetyltransferase [Anaeromyxobacteraceae bacterium]|nr:GNAT family N-acetyltransferase [Anaeromyxobacteraceae bacterium]